MYRRGVIGDKSINKGVAIGKITIEVQNKKGG